MSKNYFQFKEFIVHQEACSMKVCTDACVLGAWFAAKIPSYSFILDAGSGTGLLMLMLAQKNKGEIHGIEIDLDSLKQSKENISRSKFRERLRVFPGDFRNYLFRDKYDFIITNPPFFENCLPSPARNKNIAKHGDELSLEELLFSIGKNLRPSGTFGILLPFESSLLFGQRAAHAGFYLIEQLQIKQTAAHRYFRSVMHFSRFNTETPLQHELVIADQASSYTEEFNELMKDYYLDP